MKILSSELHTLVVTCQLYDACARLLFVVLCPRMAIFEYPIVTLNAKLKCQKSAYVKTNTPNSKALLPMPP